MPESALLSSAILDFVENRLHKILRLALLLFFRKRIIHPYVSGSAHASIAICALNCSRQNGSNSLEPLAGHLLLKFESLNLLEMYNEH